MGCMGGLGTRLPVHASDHSRVLSSTVTPNSSREVVSIKPSAMYPKRKKDNGDAAPQSVKVMFVIFGSVTNVKKKPE